MLSLSCMTSWILYLYLRLQILFKIRLDPYSTSSLLIYTVNELPNWSPLTSFKNVFKFNMKKYEKYIIYLNTHNVDWAIHREEKEKLYNFGYNFYKK